MTYLLLQTFLLLLASYFLGAFLACTVKRALMGTRHTEVAYAGVPAEFDAPLYPPVAVAAPRPAPTRSFAPPVVPRPIDPVQPRIDVIRRPEPRPLPKLVDPSRFERALMGPDLNEGMPRRAIPEIRPAVLMPVTGAYQPGTYGPPPEPEPEPELPPPPPEPVVFEPEPEPEPYEQASLAEDPREPEPVVEQREKPARLTSRLSDATTSAAAAAVAAAKAAAAASISSFARRPAPEPAPEPEALQEAESAQPLSIIEKRDDEPEDIVYEEIEDRVEDRHEKRIDVDHDEIIEDEEPEHEDVEIEEPEAEEPEDEQPHVAEEPAPFVPLVAPKPIVRQPIEGGDDFQRIRAIDANLEQRLKMEGIDSFEHIAAWSPADVKRVSGMLDTPGRIDREQWVEQAQILAKGGETYYSRNRMAALKAAAAEKAAAAPIAELAASPASEPAIAGDKPQTVHLNPSAAEAGSLAAPTSAEEEPQLSGVAAAIHGRSVAEMAAAAAAAIAAASASVTRGLRPIEPISPLTKVDPKISMPAKLSDAIKVKEAAAAQTTADSELEPPRPMPASSQGPQDDLKRIRGVGVLIEKRLNAIGITRYDQIANWTSGEIDRVSQVLEFKGRIEREGWVEQARILLNGGQTEFSRRVDRGEVDTSRET